MGVLVLLLERKAPVGAADEKGITPLHNAAITGQVRYFKCGGYSILRDLPGTGRRSRVLDLQRSRCKRTGP